MQGLSGQCPELVSGRGALRAAVRWIRTGLESVGLRSLARLHDLRCCLRERDAVFQSEFQKVRFRVPRRRPAREGYRKMHAVPQERRFAPVLERYGEGLRGRVLGDAFWIYVPFVQRGDAERALL